MDKRPVLFTAFGVTLLYFPIKCVWRFAYAYITSYWHKDIFILTSIYTSLYAHPAVAILQFFIPLVILFGLFSARKWGYYLLMLFSSLYAARLLFSLIERCMNIALLGPDKFILIAVIIFKIFYFLAMMFYFSRPRIRQIFK